MKTEYELSIAGIKRKLELFKLNDDLYLAGFILFGDVELTEKCASALLKKAPEYDILVTAESKGIPLVYEMAKQSGSNDYVVIRKGTKVYMKNVILSDVDSITTRNTQTLCAGQTEIDKMKGKRCLIVDDVISTGESIKALESIVGKAGGTVVGKMAALAEDKAADRSDIIYLERLPLFDKNGEPV